MCVFFQEEELLHLENTILDELMVIDNVRKNHHNEGHSKEKMIEKAHSLIKQAEEALHHHGHLPEGKAIQHEIDIIQVRFLFWNCLETGLTGFKKMTG